MTTAEPFTIFDAFGKPAQFASQINSRYISPKWENPERVHPRMDRDMSRLLTQTAHREMLSDARYIKTWPIVGGMVRQKADYVCAANWVPTFVGSDEAFGEVAEDALEEALKIIDVRGMPYSFAKNMHIGCQTLDVDGDYYVVFTKTKTGFPQLQTIEAHRVGSRTGNIINGGIFDGALCLNGIIYGPAGDEVGYNILADDPANDRQVPAEAMMRVHDPEWFSEGRGVSPVAYGIADWYDVRGTRDNEKVAQDVFSKLTVLESNETGTRPVMGGIMNGPAQTTASGVQVERLEKGHVRYIKNGKGNLEAFFANRPSNGSRLFEQDIISGAAYGMGWRAEMFLLNTGGGAITRAFQDQINTAIRSRWNVMRPFAQRMVRFVIACLIDRGDLPESVDWYKWDFSEPPEFTVDSGRSIQSDIEAIRAGVDCPSNVVQSRLGMRYKKFLNTKINDIVLLEKLCAKAGIEPWKVSIITKPGDALPIQGAQPAGHQQNTDDTSK